MNQAVLEYNEDDVRVLEHILRCVSQLGKGAIASGVSDLASGPEVTFGSS